MNALTDSGFVLKEHFIKKGSKADNTKFDKTFIEDLSPQARHPLVVVSVDTA
jgi:hypothetical protein